MPLHLTLSEKQDSSTYWGRHFESYDKPKTSSLEPINQVANAFQSTTPFYVLMIKM